MTNEEFRFHLKNLLAELTPEQKQLKTPAIKKIILSNENYMAWTHCHTPEGCHRSNHRYDCNTHDEYLEMLEKCKTEEWKCQFCEQPLTVYCGYTNGELARLPSRFQILSTLRALL